MTHLAATPAPARTLQPAVRNADTLPGSGIGRTTMRGIVALLALALSLPAAAQPASAGRDGEREAARGADLVYHPPTGKPRERVGGGARGGATGSLTLYSLVPEHTGRTVSEQPTLFWYLAGELPAGASLHFTLLDDAGIDPLVEVELPRPDHAGIQRIDLAQHAVKLERGPEYEWSVALVVDPERRSNDIVTAGWIDRVEVPAEIATTPQPGARSFAAHGLWYDALAAASDDPPLRDELLREVGLGEVVPSGG
jgi:hypothetical protein